MKGNIRCAAFEKSIKIYCTITILMICIKKKKKKKKKKKIINIASIFITLIEINNETHYVPKIKRKKTHKQKKTRQNCSDRIRTHSVNLQGS